MTSPPIGAWIEPWGTVVGIAPRPAGGRWILAIRGGVVALMPWPAAP